MPSRTSIVFLLRPHLAWKVGNSGLSLKPVSSVIAGWPIFLCGTCKGKIVSFFSLSLILFPS